MSNHHPRMRAQHCQMVADRLRIAGADPDIDQSNPLTILADQMIGWHLVTPPCRVGELLMRIVGLALDVQPACTC